MTEHTKLARFVTKVKKTREGYKEESFRRENLALRRQEALEKRRARIREHQAKARPKGVTSVRTGVGGRFLSFAEEFARRQEPTQQRARRQEPTQQRTKTKTRTKKRRATPRRAARGVTQYDQFGRPISVYYAHAIRRKKKKTKAKPIQQGYASRSYFR